MNVSKNEGKGWANFKFRKINKPHLNKLVRRIHRYWGHNLVPWIFLYGTTVILFNHGDWFTGREYLVLDATELDLLPAANVMARKAIRDVKNDDLELVPGLIAWAFQ